jgi:Cdc6-like AAA superfamily ATPase
MIEQEWYDLSLRASQVFTPAAPVDKRRLFAGRMDQLGQVIDAVNQKGQHAIIFGERGVGKTSLASVISEFLSVPGVLAPRANCESGDTYSTLWRKILRQISCKTTIPAIGFDPSGENHLDTLAEQLGDDIPTDDIVQTLAALSQRCLPIIVIDEFDRIVKAEVKTAIADTIKALSDYAVRATIVLVGVADSVGALLAEHHSIERALMQIPMPRMSVEELCSILDNGLRELTMTIEDEARRDIALLSKGLPHYTHLLGLHSARQAVEARSRDVRKGHVEPAIAKAVEQAQESITTNYYQATARARKDNLYSHVLLACALAATDDRGYFSAADVRHPLSIIMGKPYQIPSYARHLFDFCESPSGQLLQRTGQPRRYRYRFANPLMQPYVIMQGRKNKLINEEKLRLIGLPGLSAHPGPADSSGVDGDGPSLFSS